MNRLMLLVLISATILSVGCGSVIDNKMTSEGIIVLTPGNSIIVVDDRDLAVRPGLSNPPHADVPDITLAQVESLPVDLEPGRAHFGQVEIEYTQSACSDPFPPSGARGRYAFRENIEFGFIVTNSTPFSLSTEWEVTQDEPWESFLTSDAAIVAPGGSSKFSVVGPLSLRVGSRLNLRVRATVFGVPVKSLDQDIVIERPIEPHLLFWETVNDQLDEVELGVRNEGENPWVGNFFYKSEFPGMKALLSGDWLPVPEAVILSTSGYETWSYGHGDGLPAAGGNWRLYYGLRSFWSAEDVAWDSHPEPEFNPLPPDPPEE